jgi:hypothetical protein
MRSFRSLVDPAGRPLSFHLDRLRQTLGGFRERLREAVADAVARAVGGVVRDVIAGLLDEAGSSSSPQQYPPRRQPHAALWDRPELKDEAGRDDAPYDDEDDFRPPPPATPPRRLPLCTALVAGLRMAAWSLRRRVARRPLLVAAGIGVVTFAAVLAGSSWAVAGVGLIGSVLSLANLDAVVGTLSEPLARFRPR